MTALLASLKRIGWLMPSATEVIDDVGMCWNFKLDPPAAIVQACKQSVRRWRLRRVAKALPDLTPDLCDVGAPHQDNEMTKSLQKLKSPKRKKKLVNVNISQSE